MNKTYTFLLLVLITLSSVPFTYAEPLNIVSTADKVDLNKGESTNVRIYLLGFSEDWDIEALAVYFHSDPSLVFANASFFEEPSRDLKESHTNAFSTRIPSKLGRLSQLVSGEDYPGMNQASLGEWSWEKHRYIVPFQTLVTAKQKNSTNKVVPGDHEIKISATYKVNGTTFFTKDSITIHINSFYEQYQTWFAVIGLILGGLTLLAIPPWERIIVGLVLHRFIWEFFTVKVVWKCFLKRMVRMILKRL